MKLNEKVMLIENIKVKQNEIDLLMLELNQKEKAITFLSENLRVEASLKEKYKSINRINLNAYENLRTIIDNDDLQYSNTETTKKIKKLESDIIRKDKFIKEGFYKNQKQINDLIAENNDLKKQKEYKWLGESNLKNNEIIYCDKEMELKEDIVIKNLKNKIHNYQQAIHEFRFKTSNNLFDRILIEHSVYFNETQY